ncbi:MAG TPA: 4-phosphoerythronate dehydrogenase [Kiritimatiellia bacterium]|nr:4-phosphoerythronate dehydrogenase [Kiritimatiellia bacterium]HMP33511.1 4-phosphoerythronate dehydrogenase [Kiritimatiellia bacterium]
MPETGTWTTVCATSVAGGEEAFARLGRVVMVPEAEINASVLRGAQALVTRSKVKVTEALLADSSLRFYGTATAGTDHVDIAALERRGIAWSEAAGSNANSVAEYVLCALAHLGLARGMVWRGKTLAIIGAGHVGSRLAELAPSLGLRVLLNDPPLRDRTGNPAYRPLAEVLAEADLVSLHVPLTDHGPHPTRGMADAVFLASMKPGAVFINASRGEVVVESALRLAAARGAFAAVILDVFDHEPDIDLTTLQLADLASPHIAGYSLDGRLKGTELVYRAACRLRGVDPVWHPPSAAHPTSIELPAGVVGDVLVQHALLGAYHPMRDDERLRALPVGVPMRTHFQALRHAYPERREFPHFQVDAARCDDAAAMALRRLGFAVTDFRFTSSGGRRSMAT